MRRRLLKPEPRLPHPLLGAIPGERGGKPRLVERPGKDSADGGLPDEDVRGHATEVPRHPEELPPPLVGLSRPPPDVRSIAVEQVYVLTINRQPGAAVHRIRPVARSHHGPLVAQCANIVRIDGALVVEAEVPIGVRTVGPLRTGTAERDRDDARNARKTLGEPLHGHAHRTDSREEAIHHGRWAGRRWMNATLGAKHGPEASARLRQGESFQVRSPIRRTGDRRLMREPSETGKRVYLHPPRGDDADEFLSRASQQSPAPSMGLTTGR